MKKQLLLFILTLMPMLAMADASGSCGTNVTWTYNSTTKTLTIQGSGAMTNYYSSFDLPWDSYRRDIKTVIIEDGVTSIGRSAFYGCTGLISVTIGNGVTSVGDLAFEKCFGLTSVTIPNSVTSIGSGAFEDSPWWNNYSADPANQYGNIIYINDIAYKAINTSITSCEFKEGTIGIRGYAFENCSGLTSVTIPNSVTSIGYYAFSGCSKLTSITIPNSVTSIGNEAFFGSPWWDNYSADPANQYGNIIYINDIAYKAVNTSITSCEFKEGTIGIGGNAFSGCSGLTSVTIPNSVTSIGNGAFYGCSGLTSVTIGNSVMSIGRSSFWGCSSLTSVTIPNSVTSIEWNAFAGCSGLTSVTIGNSVTSIGSFAFSGCSSLTSVIISNSVTSIEYHAFYNCSGLTSVTIPNSVTSIGNGAFYGCSGLTSVTIGNSVMSIGRSSFWGCSSLTSVTIPNSVTSIGASVFSGCSGLTSVYSMIEDAFAINQNTFGDATYNNAKLYVPIGKKATYQSTDGWKNFANIEEFDFTPKYKLAYMVDGIEYKVYEIAEGATITPEPTPTKEGYTFSGWSEIPETMPAHDVTVTGSFAVNQYLITYMIGDEVYQKEYVDYGATIVLPYVPEREGYSFAWIDAPEKMPAHDITINGAYTSGIWGVSNDDATTNTYTTGGYKTDKPRRGVNIIRMSDGTTRKVVVK